MEQGEYFVQGFDALTGKSPLGCQRRLISPDLVATSICGAMEAHHSATGTARETAPVRRSETANALSGCMAFSNDSAGCPSFILLASGTVGQDG
jgi:hypothetical protein